MEGELNYKFHICSKFLKNFVKFRAILRRILVQEQEPRKWKRTKQESVIFEKWNLKDKEER